MELHEQRRVVDEHGLPAVASIASMLILDGEEISEMVEDRLKGGYEEFGHSLFTEKKTGEILQDIREEIADAIIYMSVLMWRENGGDNERVRKD